MDSMRSLDTSLPKPRRRKHSSQPPEQLVQAFKTAALSVTNLYKTAATDQKEAREAGYQEALDDILKFLDLENIGLDDGEGWRVRQWATERLDGSPPQATASDSEEEHTEVVRAARSTSPTAQRTAPQDLPRQSSPLSSPTHLTPVLAPTNERRSAPPVVANFTFRSHPTYPQDVDMQTSDASELNLATPSLQTEATPSPTVRLVSCGTRTPHKNTRINTRSTPGGRTSTATTGSKRKLSSMDYFDISNFGDGKDGQGGGGKRGRFT